MTTLRIKRPVAGFSLLEVLISVVIISIGLVALAALQLSLIRASNTAKMQTVALSLGKQKIEQLRSFQHLNVSGGVGVNNPCSASSNTSYNKLDSCTTSQTVGGVTYSIATTINRYVLDGTAFVAVGNTVTEAALVTDTGHAYVLGRDFKKATVKVTWTDSSNVSNALALHDVVDGIAPVDSAKVAQNSSSLQTRPVQVVINNPAGEAGVIPIAIGNGEDTAATNPKPVLNSTATETRFNIYTYAALTGSKALAQSKVETNVIGCTCDTAAAPTDSTARGYRPTYWNGTRYAPPVLTTYTPPAGQLASAASNESPYCDICCRDHNDPPGTTTAKFDPWRTTHTHYYRDTSGNLQPVAAGRTDYQEACRLIRVDGIFRVAADFNDEYYNLLQTNKEAGNTATSSDPAYAPSSTAPNDAVANYQNMVLGYLDAKVVNNSAPGTYNNFVSSKQLSAAEFSAATSYTPESSTASTLEFNNNINNPSSVTLSNNTDFQWLHSRGLYIDYLGPEALAAIASAKQNCVTNNCTTAEKQTAVLQVLPFTTINLSELSIWSPAVANNKEISVSSGAFINAASTSDPVRGRVVRNASPTADTDIDAVAKILASNSGLASLTQPIDPDEIGKLDAQSFHVPVTATPSYTFTIKVYGLEDSGSQAGFALGGAGITNCSGTFAKVSGKQVGTFTCSASVLPAKLDVIAYKYNYQSPGTSSIGGLNLSCTGAAGTLPYQAGNGDKYSVYSCANSELNTAILTGATTTVGSPLPADGKVDETTTTTVDVVKNGDTISLTFVAQTPNYGYSCAYSGTAPTKTTVTVVPATCP